MRRRFRLRAFVLATSLLAFAAGVCAQPSTGAPPPLPGEQDHIARYVGVDGALVTVVYGPPHDRNYGPKPSFSQLDVNHDGLITRFEAEAYLPLFNDYDNLVHHGPGVTPRMYEHWDQR